MKLCEFAAILPVQGAKTADQAVAGLSSDSRRVGPGTLFFALAGAKNNGAGFAAEAVRRGAVAVVTTPGAVQQPLSVPLIEVDDPRRALALSAARFFGRQPQVMVAVTGTSGKTSVAAFTRQIWEHAGLAAASIGTTGVTAPGAGAVGCQVLRPPAAGDGRGYRH